jgi:hypothetical protein
VRHFGIRYRRPKSDASSIDPSQVVELSALSPSILITSMQLSGNVGVLLMADEKTDVAISTRMTLAV